MKMLVMLTHSPRIMLTVVSIILLVCMQGSNGDESYNRNFVDSGELVSSAASSNPISESKRSWQSLQGSWGKRAEHDGIGSLNLNSMDTKGRTSNTNYDDEYEMNMLLNADASGLEPLDYSEGGALNIQKLTNMLRNPGTTFSHQPPLTQSHYQLPSSNTAEQKRAWKSMAGAWGKRLGNGDWNRFRGSWGKREPGWNNLKGLWGKRATSNNWNKLQSAWGKRDQY